MFRTSETDPTNGSLLAISLGGFGLGDRRNRFVAETEITEKFFRQFDRSRTRHRALASPPSPPVEHRNSNNDRALIWVTGGINRLPMPLVT